MGWGSKSPSKSNDDPCNNPVQPCAYCKRKAGWSHDIPIDLAKGYHQFSLHAVSNQVAVLTRPNPPYPITSEAFLIENRPKGARDPDLPDEGLAIWHVCQLANSSGTSVSLIQADGKMDLEKGIYLGGNQGGPGDLFSGSKAYFSCNSLALPNSSWRDGVPSGLIISKISAPGPEMTFNIGLSSPKIAPDAGYQKGPLDININDTMTPVIPGTQIRYETGGAEPTMQSSIMVPGF